MSKVYLVTRDSGSEGTGSWEIPIIAYLDKDLAHAHAGLAQIRRDEIIQNYKSGYQAFKKRREKDFAQDLIGGHRAENNWIEDWLRINQNEYDPQNDKWDRIDAGISYGVIEIPLAKSVDDGTGLVRDDGNGGVRPSA